MLGPDYKVEASFGHIRDLPKSKMGVNLKTFVPEYIVPDDSEKHARTLRREAKAADHVWLATDLDREGEAIAWHLADIIKVPKSKLRRVTFHEITPAAIEEAFKHPRDIDQDLVNAQQARRVVDRLVGYTMSPLLWKKIRYGLSAGRVQSVALRLIVDREREILAFKPQEYWTLEAALANLAGETFSAEVIQQKGHKLEIHDGETADKHRAALAEASYAVKSVEKRESGRNGATARRSVSSPICVPTRSTWPRARSIKPARSSPKSSAPRMRSTSRATTRPVRRERRKRTKPSGPRIFRARRIA
jgi:DNA topoisomerase-1